MGFFSWLSRNPTEAQFAKQLQRVMREGGDLRQMTYDAATHSLVTTQGPEFRLNLVNVYNEYLKLPASERKSHLVRLANVFSPNARPELPSDYSEVKSRIRPKIWSRFAFAEIELRERLSGDAKFDIPLYPLGSHLSRSLVLDEERAMRSLSNEDLKNWGISYYEAFEDAKRNLDEHTTQYAQVGEGCYCFACGDNYDSSRILGSLVHHLDVKGELIAAVPTRDIALVAGSEDEAAMTVLLQMIEKINAEEPRPLSPLPMVYRDDDWEDWIPPETHPLRSRLELLQTQFIGGLYADQKEMLERVIQDVFIATYTGVNTNESKLISYCVWSENVKAYLPQTDLIAFLTAKQENIMVRWSDAQKIVGSLMKEQDFYPVRYLVDEFPSAATLERLREASKSAL